MPRATSTSSSTGSGRASPIPSRCCTVLRSAHWRCSVDSIDKALDRAAALECQSYVGKIGPGEATLPAVAGVEGSLIYFVGCRRSEVARRLRVRAGPDSVGAPGQGRPSLQCRSPQRIPELVAVLPHGARALGRASGRDRRPARSLFQPLAAQPEQRAAHRAQYRRGRGDGRLALSRRLRRRGLSADRAVDRRHLRRRRGGEGQGRSLAADPRKLLRRPCDPLRPRRPICSRACVRSASCTTA